GVTVEERWCKVENWFEDMGPRPAGVWFIDRSPPNANYGPKTARWATLEEQSNERRNSQLLTSNGKTQTWSQWGRELNIDKTTIRKRVKKGWPIERVLSKDD